MPLIIVTGTPCSGKTFRAQQILEDFQGRSQQSSNESRRVVTYLPSYHATLDPPHTNHESDPPPEQSTNPRDVIYNSARQEKTARAEEFSAIKRALNKNTIVIADAPNYIKGFRYQLFCEAKAAGTRSVVLHTAAGQDECVGWNNARLEAWDWATGSDQENHRSAEGAQTTGPMVGGNVLGDLDPESHTAVYGDKVINEGARSPTSSTGATFSDEDENGTPLQERKTDNTMTLKSLYLSDKPEKSATTTSNHSGGIRENSTVNSRILPSFSPPPPLSSLPYSPSTLKTLFMRYEPPSPFTRWDTPLFTVPSSDSHPPYDQIWDAIFPTSAKPTSKKAIAKQQQVAQQEAKARTQAQSQPETSSNDTTPSVRQHAATILPTATAPNALQILEFTTGEIVKSILSAARAANCADGSGGEITIALPVSAADASSADENPELSFSIEIPEGLTLSQPVLQRLRRKFTQIQRGGIAHGQGYATGRRGVAEGFVRFLEAEWGVDG